MCVEQRVISSSEGVWSPAPYLLLELSGLLLQLRGLGADLRAALRLLLQVLDLPADTHTEAQY